MLHRLNICTPRQIFWTQWVVWVEAIIKKFSRYMIILANSRCIYIYILNGVWKPYFPDARMQTNTPTQFALPLPKLKLSYAPSKSNNDGNDNISLIKPPLLGKFRLLRQLDYGQRYHETVGRVASLSIVQRRGHGYVLCTIKIMLGDCMPSDTHDHQQASKSVSSCIVHK